MQTIFFSSYLCKQYFIAIRTILYFMLLQTILDSCLCYPNKYFILLYAFANNAVFTLCCRKHCCIYFMLLQTFLYFT